MFSCSTPGPSFPARQLESQEASPRSAVICPATSMLHATGIPQIRVLGMGTCEHGNQTETRRLAQDCGSRSHSTLTIASNLEQEQCFRFGQPCQRPPVPYLIAI
jgi:hypothetical protein